MLFGYHPTSSKMTSAHVRVFSKKDVTLFYKNIGSSFCKIEKYYGSQFYPFPKSIARVLAKIFPTYAFASFYVIRKTAKYSQEFIEWPKNSKLETNYFLGLTE